MLGFATGGGGIGPAEPMAGGAEFPDSERLFCCSGESWLFAPAFAGVLVSVLVSGLVSPMGSFPSVHARVSTSVAGPASTDSGSTRASPCVILV